MRHAVSLISGALFGLGLLISGMTDTARVQGWLDIAGHWDPTLAFVLGGAILPMLLAWPLAARLRRGVFGGTIPARPPRRFDSRLIGGSALFGVGWALAGFCPGPALAALSWSGLPGQVFVGAMIAGMIAYSALDRRAAHPA